MLKRRHSSAISSSSGGFNISHIMQGGNTTAGLRSLSIYNRPWTFYWHNTQVDQRCGGGVALFFPKRKSWAAAKIFALLALSRIWELLFIISIHFPAHCACELINWAAGGARSNSLIEKTPLLCVKIESAPSVIIFVMKPSDTVFSTRLLLRFIFFRPTPDD